MPANGTRLTATSTACLRPESVSHSRASLGSAGTEIRIRTRLAPSSSEKATPATAAAWGVRSSLLTICGSVPMATVPPYRHRTDRSELPRRTLGFVLVG